MDNLNRQVLLNQLIGELADLAFGDRAAAIHDHKAVGVLAGERQLLFQLIVEEKQLGMRVFQHHPIKVVSKAFAVTLLLAATA